MDLLAKQRAKTADPIKVCCGYHEKDGHVWYRQKGVINNVTAMYGAAYKNPELHFSWNSVHHTEGENLWFANHTLNDSLTDPPIPSPMLVIAIRVFSISGTVINFIYVLAGD